MSCAQRRGGVFRIALAGFFLLYLNHGQLISSPLELPPPAPEVEEPDWRIEIARESMAHAFVRLTKIELDEARQIVQTAELEAAKYDLDLFRVLAFVVAESWGNPRARSWAGARGLMQIMPATGRRIAAAREEKWRGTKSLYEIDTNISYGVWYYHHLLGIFEGDEQAAIAAYNWGPRHILWRIEKDRPLPEIYPGKVLKAQKKLEREFNREATGRFRQGLRENFSEEGRSNR